MMRKLPFSKLLALPALTVLMASCGNESAQGPASASAAASSDAKGPPGSVEELQERAIAYVTSIRTLEDFSSDAISRAIPVQLAEQDPGSRHLIARNQRLQDGYGFYVTHVNAQENGAAPVQEIMLFPPEGKTLSGPSAVCPWIGQHFVDALEAEGFQRGREVPFNEGTLLAYTRGMGGGGAELEVGLLVAPPTETDAAVGCLHGIRVAEATALGTAP